MNSLARPLAQHIHRTPSVGSVIKKLMDKHPGLTASQMASIVRESIVTQSESAGDFEGIEVIDEARVFRLAADIATRA